MTICVARHGQTNINAEHRSQDRRIGKSLNTIEIEQVMKVGENFKVETIYDDYLKRTLPNCGYKKYILKK